MRRVALEQYSFDGRTATYERVLNKGKSLERRHQKRNGTHASEQPISPPVANGLMKEHRTRSRVVSFPQSVSWPFLVLDIAPQEVA